MFWKKREKFAPSLIDIVQYEKNLLYAREHGRPPVPVQPIPNGPNWTDSEMQAMRNNRAEAEEIYNRIFCGAI